MTIEDAAKDLKKAMKGMGTDEKRIIKVLCGHSNQDRQEIKASYKTMYGKSLEDDLKSEIGGYFLKGVNALLKPTAEYEAVCVKKAIKGIGTDEQVLIEMLCTKNAQEIRVLSEAFNNLYGKSLAEEISGEEGGDFGRILASVSAGNRDDSEDVDEDLAQKEATELYDAGQGTTGTDEIEFVRIFCSRNFAQLKATIDAYQAVAENTIETCFKKEMGGNLKKALMAISGSVQNRPQFFAGLLHEAMAGAGTKDDDLLRLIVSRAEVDLSQIESEFERMYGKSLIKWVKSETSGDLEKLLVTILEKN